MVQGVSIIRQFSDYLSAKNYPTNLKVMKKEINFEEDLEDSTQKMAICLDVENDKYIGRFIVWEDNSCFLEMMKFDTTQTVIHKRVDFQSKEVLISIYDCFIQDFSKPQL